MLKGQQAAAFNPITLESLHGYDQLGHDLESIA